MEQTNGGNQCHEERRNWRQQITPEPREVEVEVGRGKIVLEAAKKIGMTEQAYYRWSNRRAVASNRLIIRHHHPCRPSSALVSMEVGIRAELGSAEMSMLGRSPRSSRVAREPGDTVAEVPLTGLSFSTFLTETC